MKNVIDGNIILVHNNSNIKSIGDILIKKAIEMGGNHLDHFDGFLTGFYKRNGFSLMSNLIFDERYKPDNWEYEPVDINDENTSIYVNEKEVSYVEFNSAENRYDNGMPDVIYRTL